jgi:hypothetical protein
MRYEAYRYLYPPRPETALAPTALPLLEAAGRWAQAKMNGTNCTIYVPPDGKAFAMGRHGPENKIGWQPGQRWSAYQAGLPGQGWRVFVGELLHSKGVGVKDTVYLFDLLVDDGDFLLGASYADRFARLEALCPQAQATDVTHKVVSDGVWLAVNHRHGFCEWFNSIRDMPGKPPIEGLCFKDPDAKLKLCVKPSSNAHGQAKCRRPAANVSF